MMVSISVKGTSFFETISYVVVLVVVVVVLVFALAMLSLVYSRIVSFEHIMLVEYDNDDDGSFTVGGVNCSEVGDFGVGFDTDDGSRGCDGGVVDIVVDDDDDDDDLYKILFTLMTTIIVTTTNPTPTNLIIDIIINSFLISLMM